MHFVVLGTHSPDVCPTSNARTRDLLLQIAPEIPTLAQKSGVQIIAGPYVNREHVTVVIVAADSSEDLDRFIVESRLPQWNSVRIIPSLPLEEGIKEVATLPSLF